MVRLPFVMVLVSACSSSRPSVPDGAFASLPKADWPCARRELVRENPDEPFREDTVTPIRYTALASCLIPIELVGEGLVGCAAQIHRDRVTYDGNRVLAMSMYTVQWTPDAVHEVGHTLTRHGNLLEGHRDDGTLHWRMALDDRGRPVHETVFTHNKDQMTVELTWRGARLDSMQITNEPTASRFEFIYDCPTI